MLVLCCGLPGAGKSTLAAWLGERMQAVVLSVDVIEAAMHAGGLPPQAATSSAVGAIVHALAAQHLAFGEMVIIDAVMVNEDDRAPVRQLANRHAAPLAIVEVTCSDRALHRTHYMSRPPLVAYHSHDWSHVERVEARYQAWEDPRLVIDAVQPVTVNGPRAEAYLLTKRR